MPKILVRKSDRPATTTKPGMVSMQSPEELLQLFLNLTPEQRKEQFQTTKEVAFYLDKENSSVVRKWIDEGQIEYTKVAGRIYVYMPFLNQWLLQLVRKHT